MICRPCCDRDHAACVLGCTCQHVGSGVPWMTAEMRHALALGLLDPPDSPPPAIIIRSNGASDGR